MFGLQGTFRDTGARDRQREEISSEMCVQEIGDVRQELDYRSKTAAREINAQTARSELREKSLRKVTADSLQQSFEQNSRMSAAQVSKT